MKTIKRVLIIEDDPYVRELEKELFEIAGYTVFDTEDAKKGIAVAAETEPDVIVVDYQLPGINGIQAVQMLKLNPKTKSIPCVIVTASATEEQLDVIKSSDAHGYITKPMNTKIFVEQVIALAGKKKSAG